MKTLADLRWAVRQNLREPGLFLSTANTGTVTVTAATNAAGLVVAGVGTIFTAEYQVGDEIQVNGVIRTVRSIQSDTQLTVGALWGAAAAGVPHYAVSRQGGWTDETITDELNAHRMNLQNRLWREAKSALYGYVTVDTVAGVGGDIVTLPVGMLSFDVAQYRASTSEQYVPIHRIDIQQKDTVGGSPWWYPVTGAGGAQKPTGRPTRFTVISPTTLELNTYPDVSVTQGLRFYGPQRFNALVLETDTLGLPEVDGFEHALELMTTAHLLKQEAAEGGRAQVYEKDGEQAYRVAVAPWIAAGRDSGPRSVVLLDD